MNNNSYYNDVSNGIITLFIIAMHCGPTVCVHESDSSGLVTKKFFLSLSFLIYKMKIKITPLQFGCVRD